MPPSRKTLEPEAPPAGVLPPLEKWVPRNKLSALARLGIESTEQLVWHLPFRYEDRCRFGDLKTAQDGQVITLRGRVHQVTARFWRGVGRVHEAVLAPAVPTSQAQIVRCRWIRFLPKVVAAGAELIVHGKLKRDKSGWMLTQPEYEAVALSIGEEEEASGEEHIHLNRLTPIYPLTEGMSQRWLRALLFRVTQGPEWDCPEPHPPEPGWMPYAEALRQIHFPDSPEMLVAARKRLVLDEFLMLQCLVLLRRRNHKTVTRVRPTPQPELAQKFLASLPFALTQAQQRVCGTISQDLQSGQPMNRLLQGDVGSGKTVVAVYAMLLAVGQGSNAVLMAPTQILAEQHYLNLRRWMDGCGVEVRLHVGGTKSKKQSGRQLGLFRSSGGLGQIIVGTHALLYEAAELERVGLVVIDEQHKFGVLQRLTLVKKAAHPDILVMTATPIPRTLSMTLYGDLDVSTLDELPPGRQQIKTLRRAEKDLERVWKFVREEAGRGRQAYVVYPLVDESEKVDAKAVVKEYERLCKILAPLVVGLLHGRMKPDEKEDVMQRFRVGKIQVLVSTSVIEVGVDVPNATVMVIENAERFGLAQLHQLRGRIGRGAELSYCALIGEPKSLAGWQRLKIMEETSDGFRIAEEDLRIRGPGNMLGTEQSGLPPLRVGNLIEDFALLEKARKLAEELLERDPTLEKFTFLRERIARVAVTSKALVTVG